MVTERLVLASENDTELIRLHLARYEFAKELVIGKNVLDVACGSGYGSAILKAAGAAKVVGLDISSKTIEYAKADFQNQGVEFVVGNAEDLSAYRGFDVIVSFETIEHLQHPEKFLQEISRALAPDGILIISTPRREREGSPGNPFHVKEWTEDEFAALLSRHFRLVNSYGQYGLEKKSFPFSRTLQRIIFRLLFPENFMHYNNFPVLAQPPCYKGFQCNLTYIVVVCRKKQTSEKVQLKFFQIDFS